MKLIRGLSRQMFAISKAKEGCDAIINSKRHAEKFQTAYKALPSEKLPQVDQKTAEYLSIALGTVQVVAAGAVWLKFSPKTAGALLTIIQIPVTLVRWLAK